MNILTHMVDAAGLPLVEASQIHLGQSQMTYGYHFWHAIKNGSLLIYWGLTSFIHAFIPALFPGTAAKGTIKIFYETIYEHPNPEFRALVDDYERRYPRRG